MKVLAQHQSYRPSKTSHLMRCLNNNSILFCSLLCVGLIIYMIRDPRLSYGGTSTIYGHDDLSIATEDVDSSATEGIAKIGKLSMLYGEPGQVYERSIQGHQPHNERFGYPFHVLHEKTLPAYWSKPAFILQHLLSELAKPESQRLEWLVWFDADIVLMNPKIPLEIFLPPEQDWSHIHVLVTNDHRGLNNGVFFLRVHEFNVWLMNACLGTETYNSRIELEFGDQSALMYWLNQDRFRNNVMHVPQRWFNAYAGHRGEDSDQMSDPTQPQTKFRKNSVREGDLLVHHAGHKSQRARRMEPWVDLAEQHSSAWELELEHTAYLREIDQFWIKTAPNERRTVNAMNQKLAEAKARKAQQRVKRQKKARR